MIYPRTFGVSLLMVLAGACSGDGSDGSFDLPGSSSGLEASELDDAASELESSELDSEEDEASFGSLRQALTLGSSCLVLPGDGLSCPGGYKGKLRGRVFTCEKTVFTDPSCPFGWSQRVGRDRDPCKVILCTLGDCSDKRTRCPSGYKLELDSSGNRDRCTKLETADPNGCFGAKKGASCPSDAEEVEVVDGKFRCVDIAAPSCLSFGFSSLTTLPGPDECRSGTVFVSDPQCDSNLSTLIFHDYEEDVRGNADKCVAHGWPLPMSVQ